MELLRQLLLGSLAFRHGILGFSLVKTLIKQPRLRLLELLLSSNWRFYALVRLIAYGLAVDKRIYLGVQPNGIVRVFALSLAALFDESQ